MRIDMTGWVMKEHEMPDSKITVIKENDDLSIDDLLSDKFLVKEDKNNGDGLIYNS